MFLGLYVLYIALSLLVGYYPKTARFAVWISLVAMTSLRMIAIFSLFGFREDDLHAWGKPITNGPGWPMWQCIENFVFIAVVQRFARTGVSGRFFSGLDKLLIRI